MSSHTAFSRADAANSWKISSWEGYALSGEWEISRYDALLREVGRQEGHDWRLLSAIAFRESHFDSQATSPRGAAGLMQIMPSVARSYDVDEDMIRDPRTNVTLAAKLLTSIQRSLRFSLATSREDRMSIMLASYNGGIGHVMDARRLAAKHGGDPNSWADVARYLSLSSDPAYASDEVVACGPFSGSGETIAYVDGVMGKYRAYCGKFRG